MKDVNRRKLLKTTGVGAGVALGAGSATTSGASVLQSDGSIAQTGNPGQLSTFTATVTGATFGLDVNISNPPDFGNNSSVYTVDATNAGDPQSSTFFSFEGEILNNGRWRPIDGNGDPASLEVDILEVALSLLFEALPLQDWSQQAQNLAAGYLQLWQETNADPKVFEIPFNDAIDVLATETDLPIKDEQGNIIEGVDTILALVFGIVAQIDSQNTNYNGTGIAVDSITLVNDSGNLALADYSLEDIGALLQPLIAALDLNQTQAEAIIGIIDPLVPSIGLSGLLDTSFLYDPTASNIANLISVLGMVIGDSQFGSFEELVNALGGFVTDAVGALVNWDSMDTSLQILPPLIGSLDQLIYDLLLGMIAIPVIPEPSGGSYDPRSGQSVPAFTLDGNGIVVPLNIQGLTIPDIDIPFELRLTSGESGPKGATGSFTFKDTTGDTVDDAADVGLVDNRWTLDLDQLDIVGGIEDMWDPAEIAPSLDNLVWNLAGLNVAEPQWSDPGFSGTETFPVSVDITNNGQTDDVRVTLSVLDGSDNVLSPSPYEKVKEVNGTETFTFDVEPDSNYASVNVTAEAVDDDGGTWVASPGDLYPDGELESLLVDLDVMSIIEAVDIEGAIQQIDASINDTPGRHVLGFSGELTNLDTAVTDDQERQNLADSLPDQLPNGVDAPKDIDNDGLFEDTLGDGTVNIFDVQTFFLDYDSQPAANYPGAYNFSGEDATAVGIVDVQGLFNKVTSQ